MSIINKTILLSLLWMVVNNLTHYKSSKYKRFNNAIQFKHISSRLNNVMNMMNKFNLEMSF